MIIMIIIIVIMSIIFLIVLIEHCYQVHRWRNVFKKESNFDIVEVVWLMCSAATVSSQPSCKDKCWQCSFLQTTDVLKLFMLRLCFFGFIFLNLCCDVSNFLLIWLAKNYLVRVGDSLVKNIWFCLNKHGWKMSQCFLKYSQWFNLYKCWNGHGSHVPHL